jgi:hypothetical protein
MKKRNILLAFALPAAMLWLAACTKIKYPPVHSIVGTWYFKGFRQIETTGHETIRDTTVAYIAGFCWTFGQDMTFAEGDSARPHILAGHFAVNSDSLTLSYGSPVINSPYHILSISQDTMRVSITNISAGIQPIFFQDIYTMVR